MEIRRDARDAASTKREFKAATRPVLMRGRGFDQLDAAIAAFVERAEADGLNPRYQALHLGHAASAAAIIVGELARFQKGSPEEFQQRRDVAESLRGRAIQVLFDEVARLGRLETRRDPGWNRSRIARQRNRALLALAQQYSDAAADASTLGHPPEVAARLAYGALVAASDTYCRLAERSTVDRAAYFWGMAAAAAMAAADRAFALRDVTGQTQQMRAAAMAASRGVTICVATAHEQPTLAGRLRWLVRAEALGTMRTGISVANAWDRDGGDAQWAAEVEAIAQERAAVLRAAIASGDVTLQEFVEMRTTVLSELLNRTQRHEDVAEARPLGDTTNCQRVVVAALAASSGALVPVPTSAFGTVGTDTLKSLYQDAYGGTTPESCREMQDVVEMFTECGPGAKGLLFIVRTGAERGSAHVCIVENIEGQVFVLEYQRGRVVAIDEDGRDLESEHIASYFVQQTHPGMNDTLHWDEGARRWVQWEHLSARQEAERAIQLLDALDAASFQLQHQIEAQFVAVASARDEAAAVGFDR